MRHISLVLAALAAGLANGPAQGGEIFGNARFGFFAEIPPGFTIADPEPENGDGRTFHTADRSADLVLSGGWVMDADFAGEVAQDKTYETEDGWTITYQSKITPKGTSWSGSKGDRIFYARAIATCGGQAHAGYRLEYPAARKAEFDAAIALLNSTLKPGEGDCG